MQKWRRRSLLLANTPPRGCLRIRCRPAANRLPFGTRRWPRCHRLSANRPAPDYCVCPDYPVAISRSDEMRSRLAPPRRCAAAEGPGCFALQYNLVSKRRKFVGRGSPQPSRPCSSELAQDNSERRGPQDSVALQTEGVARPLRETLPGNAKRPNENALIQSWVAAGALRKTPRLRLARRIFVRTPSRDRRVIPLFAAQARWPAETRRWRHRSLRRSEEHTSELQSRQYLVCRLLLEKKKIKKATKKVSRNNVDIISKKGTN